MQNWVVGVSLPVIVCCRMRKATHMCSEMDVESLLVADAAILSDVHFLLHLFREHPKEKGKMLSTV